MCVRSEKHHTHTIYISTYIVTTPMVDGQFPKTAKLKEMCDSNFPRFPIITVKKCELRKSYGKVIGPRDTKCVQLILSNNIRQAFTSLLSTGFRTRLEQKTV